MDARLEAILARLPEVDAIYLRDLVEPPWRVRQRRLEARDAAIRSLALNCYSDLRSTRARAEAIARDLRRLGGARDDRGEPDSKRGRLITVDVLLGGHVLTTRQLENILAGRRSPAKQST